MQWNRVCSTHDSLSQICLDLDWYELSQCGVSGKIFSESERSYATWFPLWVLSSKVVTQLKAELNQTPNQTAVESSRVWVVCVSWVLIKSLRYAQSWNTHGECVCSFCLPRTVAFRWNAQMCLFSVSAPWSLLAETSRFSYLFRRRLSAEDPKP